VALSGTASDVSHLVTGAPALADGIGEARTLLEDVLARLDQDAMAAPSGSPAPPDDIANHPRRSAIWDHMVENLERVKVDVELDVEDMASLATGLFLLHELLATQEI